MADGRGQGIGSIQGHRLLKPQHDLDHGANLFFVGPAVSHHRFLDFQRRVLKDRNIVLARGHQSSAPGVSQFESAPGVFGKEQVLNGHLLRCITLQNFHDILKNPVNFSGERQGVRRFDDAGPDAENLMVFLLHKAVTGNPAAGIHPQHEHQLMASITSSAMSKLEYTWLTSSWSSMACIRLIICWAFLPSILTVFLGILVTSARVQGCLLYTSPSPRDRQKSRMPSSA
eukprot:TRINITY_DN2789_c0_g1_i1.p1 TRINITY_DN2789_c0_g1~~TRINITY_DN2789_c0_g1_i1.p1  ORF type:complete len:229 (-),score=37.58 TRINITY_DN2789_c0_g1_i1:40-726(-)